LIIENSLRKIPEKQGIYQTLFMEERVMAGSSPAIAGICV
jgi:hypothetical protein